MPREQAMSLLAEAKKRMPKGIYAIEQKDTLEFVSIPLSTTQIKKWKRDYKKMGVKVYANY